MVLWTCVHREVIFRKYHGNIPFKQSRFELSKFNWFHQQVAKKITYWKPDILASLSNNRTVTKRITELHNYMFYHQKKSTPAFISLNGNSDHDLFYHCSTRPFLHGNKEFRRTCLYFLLGGDIRFYSIGFVFMRYFNNLNRNVWYCGTI